jgi:hypothetical protein
MRFVSLALCVLLLSSAARAESLIHRLDGKTVTTAQAAARADAELKADNVMGAQLAILDRGHVAWTHAYGLRDAKQNLPMTTDTNIWAASITNSDNGELAFRPLLEKLLGDTVTPWVWESYTRKAIMQNEEHTGAK